MGRLIKVFTKNLDYLKNRNRVSVLIFRILSSPLFWVMICSLAFRLIYYRSVYTYSQFVDSGTYLNYPEKLYEGQVNALRTPGYPYFLMIIRSLFGSAKFLPAVAVIQDLLLYLSILFFYKISESFIKNRFVLFLTSLTYGCLPSIINYSRTILTESLSITAFVVFTYFVVRYIKKPGIVTALLIGLSTFILVMIRPSFLYITALVVLFWIVRAIFRKSELKFCMIGIAGAILSILLITGYSYLNFVDNKVFSVSSVSDFNELGVIIKSDVYLGGSDEEMVKAIYQLKVVENKDSYAATVQTLNKFGYIRVAKFNSTTIKNHPIPFAKYMVIHAFDLADNPINSVYASYKMGSNWVVLYNNLFPVTYGAVYLLLFIYFIFVVGRFVSGRSIPWEMSFVWLLLAGYLFTTLSAGPGEYARLMYPTWFLIILLIYHVLDSALPGVSTGNEVIKKQTGEIGILPDMPERNALMH